MHILVVTDQHPQSLGGVQVALRLQRKYLERLGHRVSIVAPKLHRNHESYPDDIDLPSFPITKDREYGASWPGRRTDRLVMAALQSRPPIDLIHIQGDFWGALIGYRIARLMKVPVVHTMHNNVHEGTRAVTSWAPFAFWMLNVWRRATLGPTRSRQRGAWRYLASLAEHANVVTAPSAHFAHELENHGVSPSVVVTPNGVDDDLIEQVTSAPSAEAERAAGAQQDPASDTVRAIWLGRMSHEKRIMEFLKALTLLDPDLSPTLRVDVYGSGLLVNDVARYLREHALEQMVTLRGSVSHDEALMSIAHADVLVQTSVGFETQGLTVFEAAALGTPSIICDPNIAEDINVEPMWRVSDSSIIALARSLEEVVRQLRRERKRIPSKTAHRFLQSEQTAEMVRLYDTVLS